MEANLRRRRRRRFLLPEDIIFDVLSRLPAKVLCRFKCVCKGWRALISDKAFVADHKSRAAPLIAGVFTSQRMGHKFELRVMDMDDGTILRVFEDMPMYLAPTRLDLICAYDQDGSAMIVDPAPGRVLAVSKHNPWIDKATLPRSHYILGRAAPSGNYKVLHIHESFDGNDQLCEIAAINDCGTEPTWRQRPVPPVVTHRGRYQRATVNGVLYLLSYTDDDHTLEGWYHVASFNLESEEWMEMIDGPVMRIGEDDWTEITALAELKETLNMIQTVYCPLTYSNGDYPQPQPQQNRKYILQFNNSRVYHADSRGIRGCDDSFRSIPSTSSTTHRTSILLPEDITFDVLSRLPVKELCRLRCVCKGWRVLISDKAFVAAHKSRAGPIITGVFRSQCTGHKLELWVMDMDDGSILRVFKGVPWHLVPTRLDLICVYDMCQGGAAMIVDPAAGRMLAVGEPNPRFVTQQLTSHSHCSLGRAALSGAYKVLRIHRSYGGNDTLCEIATINDDSSWYNGLASFDFESEDWTERIDGPTMGLGKDVESYRFALAELKGTLNMVQTVSCSHTNQVDYDLYINIWLLIDPKKSSWIKQHTIHMPQNVYNVKVLDVLGDGRILLLNDKSYRNIFSYGYIIQFYNPTTQAFTDSMELPNEFIHISLVVYTGSLLSRQMVI
ncbi:hypothetical protein HU200_042913 [Digitaria exilis]|uniref:F-box domain-containing protein n=1 Tax=Digitaria exilis TaxID=1010633 RepID=A0A835B4Q4_9POAL|nr:hypothetical protein HU200_042913 [Digitaria exilis]